MSHSPTVRRTSATADFPAFHGPEARSVLVPPAGFSFEGPRGEANRSFLLRVRRNSAARGRCKAMSHGETQRCDTTKCFEMGIHHGGPHGRESQAPERESSRCKPVRNGGSPCPALLPKRPNAAHAGSSPAISISEHPVAMYGCHSRLLVISLSGPTGRLATRSTSPAQDRREKAGFRKDGYWLGPLLPKLCAVSKAPRPRPILVVPTIAAHLPHVGMRVPQFS